MSKRYKMSSIQKRMYASEIMIGTNTMYNTPTLLEISGKIDACKIKEAINIIIAKHEILRTTFSNADGEFYQIVHDGHDIDVQEIPLNERVEPETYCRQFVKPFNLSELPLIRMAILNSGEKCYLFIDIHHIICDGISLSILLSQLSSVYNGNPIEKSKYQYKNYSSWQNKKDFNEHSNFWSNEYSTDFVPTRLLPQTTDEGIMQNDGDVFISSLDIKTELLQHTCSELGCTEFLFLLTAFMTFLSRQNGEKKVVVGAPFAGRTLPGMNHLLKVPTAIRFELVGKLQPYVSGRDLILHIIGMIGVDGVVNTILKC